MSALLDTTDALHDQMIALGRAARAAAAALATVPGPSKDRALRAAAAAIRARAAEIKAANAEDMANARDLSGPLRERLMLDDKRIEAMAKGLEDIADFPDPIGGVLAEWTRPNGLRIQRVRVPLGVVGIIYESRPNVTADAGGICLKSGNAAILRGGSESIRSSRAIASCLAQGLREAGLPEATIQLVPTTDRAAVGHMLTMRDYIDVIIPRGGKSLIQRIADESRVPVIKHLDGNCHVYVDAAADLEKARKVVLNAKMRRTSICGAAETLLVDRAIADKALPLLVKDLLDAGCAVRGDAAARAADPRVTAVAPEDWDTEYLDAIIACGVVDGVDAAIDHINAHSSHHTESILTEDPATAERFLSRVDSGIVLWNASTQFADGGEFGMGAEIGISTDKFHARGPVGAEQLTSYKYVVRGDGQTRP
ncbi:glutamate-5-semialdehyde dehydrogenase [Azospirillum lipoferum]|uniref:Gamma-glutamyl phosphate reductase n=1 Tax=Azospirillum lipoferum TaxID=193 RepID=A0A5A9GWN9_AZOLI|nr:MULTISPECIES: glutamate-5-semialdehyde dehydrogenase [Azospirillum]KAA0598115.1 glutamate-5-semialdehyde dehydrogenase [Azospirillum lipoferum]MCP1613763.1 glutamate-5-semialdehyde dehydrogenase [Azospirillum lipoferum]MDW5534785.1 glutamate-5-semialdehyde dehydrogenase [Azospirillum sp. NL1]